MTEDLLPEQLSGNELANKCHEIFQGQDVAIVGEAILNLLANFIAYTSAPEDDEKFYEGLIPVMRDGVRHVRARFGEKAKAMN